MVLQVDLVTYEEVKKPDVNIDEECDYGGFTNQGRFVFFQERQYELIREEFKAAKIKVEPTIAEQARSKKLRGIASRDASNASNGPRRI